jgi:CBS-domain-containing membrane protein
MSLLYVAPLVVPVMRIINCRRPPGSFVALFAVLHMPARVGLDFLRVADACYAGLTAAQWTAMALMVLVPIAWREQRR